MANALSRRRPAYDSDFDGESVVETGAPYQLSRAAMRNRYGTRRIDASAPQAANSMSVPTPGISGSRTPDSTWGAFFRNRPSLAPSGPADATGMASSVAGSSLFDPKTPFKPMASTTPDSLFKSAIADNERWFDARGEAFQPTSRARRPGDRFTSRYGSGSVGLSVDAERKLAMLGVDEDLF
jgi:hypothetical protein